MSTRAPSTPAPPALATAAAAATSSASSTQPLANSTPPRCIADFCLIPLGTGSASVAAQIADVQRLLKKSGLVYSMHSAGTTIEGSWEEVMRLIGQAHTMMHEQGVVRVQTDIRVGTRTDKTQSFAEKVSAVERLLAEDRDDGEDGGGKDKLA